MAGRRSEADAAETRQALVDAAVELFARDGIEVPLAKIAARAGVTPGAIYRHFDSRRALVQAAVAEQSDRLMALLTTGGDGDLLRAAGYSLIDRPQGWSTLVLELATLVAREPIVGPAARAGFVELERTVRAVVDRLIQEGRIGAGYDAAALTRYLVMLTLGAIVTAAVDLEPVDRQRWNETIDSILNATTYRPPPTDPQEDRP